MNYAMIIIAISSERRIRRRPSDFATSDATYVYNFRLSRRRSECGVSAENRRLHVERTAKREAHDPHDGRVGRKIRSIASRLRCLLIRILLVVNCNYMYVHARSATPMIGEYNRSEMNLTNC